LEQNARFGHSRDSRNCRCSRREDELKILLLILTAFFLQSCDSPLYALQTTASWYSYESCIKEGTSGRITASGEKFNHNELTAAMWDVPFGTRFKVTNIKNGKSVIVRITDRGPAKRLVKKGRLIDLSKASFAQIAKLSDGVIPVKIEKILKD
jgi:rare lipoprotein A